VLASHEVVERVDEPPRVYPRPPATRGRPARRPPRRGSVRREHGRSLK
jgi:hypothetical protein